MGRVHVREEWGGDFWRPVPTSLHCHTQQVQQRPWAAGLVQREALPGSLDTDQEEQERWTHVRPDRLPLWFPTPGPTPPAA